MDTSEVKKSTDHIIPHMVITSAEDTLEEQINGAEVAAVNCPNNDKAASAEFTMANSASEEKPSIDFEDISDVVKDVVTKCTESVSHSVRQRPLVIELEKNVQQEESARESSIKCPPPPPPVPPPVPSPVSIIPVAAPSSSESTTSVSATAMQRPLVFEGAVHKTEQSPEIQIDSSLEQSVKSRKECLHKEASQEIRAISESPIESTLIPESPTSNKKEGLHGVKKFFDSILHHEVKESIPCPEEPVSPKEYVSPSTPKSEKGVFKKLFQSSKSDDTKSQPSPSPEFQIDISPASDKEKPATPETPQELKGSTSFAKDAKHNIKTFFDAFKHESSETSPQTTVSKKAVSQPDIVSELASEQSNIPESPKETKDSSSSFVKDTKQNIKTFFDSLKHEHSDKKHKDACKKSASHSDFSKVVESTDIDSTIKEQPEISKHKETVSFTKGAKQNVKTFFDSLKPGTSKHEDLQKKGEDDQPLAKEAIKVSEESAKASELSKEPALSTKETKQTIKTFFDSFKLGDLNTEKEMAKKTATSEPDLHNLPACKTGETQKDTKTNIKTFCDNFKLGDLNTAVKDEGTVSKSEPNKKLDEKTAAAHKESKNPVKKLFSFKHGGESEISGCVDVQLPKKSSKEKSDKVVKSVKIDLQPTYSNGSESISASFSNMNAHEMEIVSAGKERAQSVPSDPMRNKTFSPLSSMKKPDISSSNLDSADEPHVEHKGGHHGIKKFFHSFKNEKIDIEKGSLPSVIDSNAAEMSAKNEESKATEKSAKEKKGKGIKRSLSDKVSREEVVQNFKGFFDSLSHKSSSKKSEKESEHIYDVVEVKPELTNQIPTVQITCEDPHAPKSAAVKGETHGLKKILSSFSSKDTAKSGSESYITENKTELKLDENLPKVNEPQMSIGLSKDVTLSPSTSVVDDLGSSSKEPGSPPKSDKSVFNSIGDNILALKEKVLHPKEKRKSDIVEDSMESYASPKAKDLDKEISQKGIMPEASKQKKDVSKGKPVPPEKPAQIKQSNKIKFPTTDAKGESQSNPSSLYDTCCMKLAILLRDKAVDIVSGHTKTPPPKPPKPSAEAIARARATAVYKRIQAQKFHSIGENFPVGCDGIVFADDETESSCDYKDVENFNYIMDYELINRYKVDTSKLDTFSLPSTCSGLTSYYTADTITLSDGIMETISLSSDMSYNVKPMSPASKSGGKLPTKDEYKSKIGAASTSKSVYSAKEPPVIKRAPPPVPPKPVILQNISKIKGKPDDKAISPCVNGLSLSPRLQNKYSKDPAAVQKRPLMVADIKGTQFSSLQHPKKPQKPIRNFGTVPRSETLKKVPGAVSSSTLSGSDVLAESSSLQSCSTLEKRTKSPPRPPLPNIVKKPEKSTKPERPPPPTKIVKSPFSHEATEENIEREEKIEIDGVMGHFVNISEQKEPHLLEDAELSDANKPQDISVSEVVINSEKARETETVAIHTSKSDFEIHQDNLNNNTEATKDNADSLNNNIEVSVASEDPKPPPRSRRIRSRTVEIVPVEKQEERLKRSQSLSEIDVEKRVTFLDAEKAKIDSKSLYTTVNKNRKKLSNEISRSSPDLISGRPLPPPPPPPRRFRSLERRNKSRKVSEKTMSEQNIFEQVTAHDPHKEMKAPARRKKSDKQRFFSLHSDQREEIASFEGLKRSESVPCKPERKFKSSLAAKYDINANISSFDAHQCSDSSNPNIPNTGISGTDSASKLKSRKESESPKRSHSSWYDENEALGDSWEKINSVTSQGSIDEYRESPKVPLRRKSEGRKKSRETSKFYVSMEEDVFKSPSSEGTSPFPPTDKGESPMPPADKEGLLLVDKETSPLPLDCSEKSVQTSLETLSQGITSRDDQSEDTDDLLDLAQTLQKELSTIINRHKSVNEGTTEDTPSPPLSATASEKNLTVDYLGELKKASSVRSSTSEVWPITSSDESDVERVGEDSSNISEVSVKKKKKKVFYIAQEIMTSEEAFVDALKLLTVDFKAAVEAANKQKNMTIIPDESLAQILNHLPQLQQLNENLLMELKDRIENWDKHEKIADVIVKMGPFLKLYSWYIQDFESNVSLLEECKRKYPAFSQTIKEFEVSARCRRLALNHYMLKPIQRIPQYRLLLQEYLHHLSEDSKDYQDTVTALQIVSEVANHANDSMKQGDNAQKLISIQNSIVGHKEIVKPGRVFVREGELMKLSRKGMQPRWFVLFNDLLLYLTPVQQGLYKLNHEFPLAGMKVAIPIQQDYQNEFSIISTARSFTLAARSQEERHEWITALTKVIEENASKRKTFTNSRLNQKAQDKTSSEEEGAFVLGKKAPVWIPDARVTMCQLCTSEFTVTFRRHHCRACGKVICSICSSHRISLPYLGNRIARVCDECHARLGQGSSACTESGETDSDNQQIAVKSHLRTDNRHLKKNKRSLPSVLKEVCANDQGSSISGYLHKRTGKSWKRDWFVVKDKVLYEYKASEDVAALRSVPLLGYQIELFDEVFEGIDASLLFQLTHPGQAPIIFYADTVGSAERWVSALKTATVLE